MKSYAYDVTLYKDNSPEVFRESCAKFEKKYPEAVKDKLHVDVDGSTIQRYFVGVKEVLFYDDYDIGAVYVLSDVKIAI